MSEQSLQIELSWGMLILARLDEGNGSLNSYFEIFVGLYPLAA